MHDNSEGQQVKIAAYHAFQVSPSDQERDDIPANPKTGHYPEGSDADHGFAPCPEGSCVFNFSPRQPSAVRINHPTPLLILDHGINQGIKPATLR